jgi:RimJ/RimL family protein N-acetyltransferase
VKIPTVVTERLVLRPFTEGDADRLHQILGAEGVLRYFPSSKPPSLDGVQRFIQGQLRHWQEHGFGWWAVEVREAPGLVGWNGLQYLPETDEVEIAFLLSPKHWGRGLATEGAREGLRYGFGELGLETIVGIVHPENGASQRVLEKLGLARTAETEYFGMRVYRYAVEAANYLGAAGRRADSEADLGRGD